MVEREVKKKTQVYGLTAVVTALLAVSLISAIISPTILNSATTTVSSMKTFSSMDELKNFLNTNQQADSSKYFTGGFLDARFVGTAPVALLSLGISVAALGSSDNQLTYSTTNVQVSGVDEADIVKTDGVYIYTLGGNFTSHTLFIVKADPQDLKVISKIELENDTCVAGLYLGQNSNKLVILGSKYDYLYPVASSTDEYYPYSNFFSSIYSFIYVYDITDKANPTLAKNYTISGSYFNSRMIGDYVYAVISECAYVYDSLVNLPVFCNDNASSEILPTSIYYGASIKDSYFTYTTIVAVNVNDLSQEATTLTILMSSTSNMFVSPVNIYVTCPTENWQVTAVYRINVNGSNLKFEAKGSVPGSVLNQYSMDEYNGNFRIATTNQTGSWISTARQANLYVLNSDLTMIGKIEGIASGESIYAARFVGDRCYLVTFRQTDPFFVLDLSDPAAPKIAGELKIPGYSSYLHPYDENHVIGIGKDGGNVKLSLFDVTNPSNPTLLDTFIVNGSYSYSSALNDPKAFLFDKSNGLLVLPISIYNYETNSTSWSYNYWQGAYVFTVSLTDGFTLKGNVTHQEGNSSLYYYCYDITSGLYYYGLYYNQNLNRALYIENTLYTISNSAIYLHDIESLEFITKLTLQ